MPKRVQLEIHFIFGTWNVFVGVSLFFANVTAAAVTACDNNMQEESVREGRGETYFFKAWHQA